MKIFFWRKQAIKQHEQNEKKKTVHKYDLPNKIKVGKGMGKPPESTKKRESKSGKQEHWLSGWEREKAKLGYSKANES